MESILSSPVLHENATVLIVDDNARNLQVLGQIIKSFGCKIAFAENGDKALEYLFAKKADIVLLDIMMPVKDGYQTCREIKETPALTNIPIIFITAMNDSEHEKKGFEAGAVDYITKPFNPEIVKARVLTHLRLKLKNDLLEKLAGIDGLTDIPNRRMLDETLFKEFRRALRRKSFLTFFMIDIDNFKAYNDNYGHSSGDYCLRSVAGEIKKSINRAGDFAARFGGEEFAVILPDTDRESAFFMSEKIRKNIENLGIVHEFSSIAKYVTISIGGVSLVPEPAIEINTIIEAADKALYESKKNGKNRSSHSSVFI